MVNIADMRPTEMDVHPVVTESYLIPTHPIGKLLALVEKCVRRRTSGLLVYGLPRQGKTRAIKYCVLVIQQMFPRIPTCIFSAPTKVTVSEDAFFTNLLEALGHKQLSGKVFEKRRRAINFMSEKALKCPSKVFLIFIDEAQKFRNEHFEWLRDIYDQLELVDDVRLLVVLVGQADLISLKRQFVSSKMASIVTRFMIRDMEFKGLCSEKEMRECLKCYDDAVFPEESGWRYTQFFFPLAYKNGFRLENVTSRFWHLFGVHHRENDLVSDLNVPMRFFTKSVEILFSEYFDRDDSDFSLTDELINEVISESWFLVYQSELLEMDQLD